jgi:hypothetical protein
VTGHHLDGGFTVRYLAGFTLDCPFRLNSSTSAWTFDIRFGVRRYCSRFCCNEKVTPGYRDAWFAENGWCVGFSRRPGTRHVVLDSGSHDAHLDATAEWAEALRNALVGTAP